MKTAQRGGIATTRTVLGLWVGLCLVFGEQAATAADLTPNASESSAQLGRRRIIQTDRGERLQGGVRALRRARTKEDMLHAMDVVTDAVSVSAGPTRQGKTSRLSGKHLQQLRDPASHEAIVGLRAATKWRRSSRKLEDHVLGLTILLSGYTKLWRTYYVGDPQTDDIVGSEADPSWRATANGYMAAVENQLIGQHTGRLETLARRLIKLDPDNGAARAEALIVRFLSLVKPVGFKGLPSHHERAADIVEAAQQPSIKAAPRRALQTVRTMVPLWIRALFLDTRNHRELLPTAEILLTSLEDDRER